MRIFLLIIFLASSIIPIYAQDFFEPEWSEFCPKKYRNIDPSGTYFNKSKNYWAERKRMFDKRIAQCNSLDSNARGDCYANLREIELRATETRASEVRNNTLKYMLINSMY